VAEELEFGGPEHLVEQGDLWGLEEPGSELPGQAAAGFDYDEPVSLAGCHYSFKFTVMFTVRDASAGSFMTESFCQADLRN